MRTTIHYGGQEYIVAKHASDVMSEIDAILSTGEPGWIRVNHGRGQLRIADLLIGPSTSVGVVDTSDPD